MGKHPRYDYNRARYEADPQTHKDRTWSRSLMTKFGITVEDYNRMYDA